MLSELCLHNINALKDALIFCSRNTIGDFRITSRFLPLYTHPEYGYTIDDLPERDAIRSGLDQIRLYANQYDIRLTFHPDQFILLSSPDPDITRRSIAELAYQAKVSDLIGADVINIHGGGAYGDKADTLKRIMKRIDSLPQDIRTKLTMENDDRVYTPEDLLPLCGKLGIPFVYDVHHHRCLRDSLSVEEATEKALSTWDREPLFHISSPRNGWKKADRRKHHDYINISDFPHCWMLGTITIEVEAKAKECAVIQLGKDLLSQQLLHLSA
jgi:UV DNA damage endonuclease